MGKKVRATIRATAIGGDYPVPTSERAYQAHRGLIDVVMPFGGGLQADGTWARMVPTDFTLSLPRWAKQAGQRYIPRLDPGHHTDGANLRAVLDSQRLQEKAAQGAVELALTGHDAPWGGVLYDVLDVPVGYVKKQNRFIRLLAERVHSAGLSFEIDYRGVREEDESWSMSLDVIGAAADAFNYYMYGWWRAPCSTGPLWWARESIENALRHGVKPGAIYLGIANYARYWPVTGDYNTAHDLTYRQAVQLATGPIEWVGKHKTGFIGEKYAKAGRGHVWLQDNDTVRPRLSLVDEYGLAGIMLFCAGMGDESTWQAIRAWKRPSRPQRVRAGPLGMHSSSLSAGGYLIGKDRG